jgi:hypothetical protein
LIERVEGGVKNYKIGGAIPLTTTSLLEVCPSETAAPQSWALLWCSTILIYSLPCIEISSEVFEGILLFPTRSL